MYLTIYFLTLLLTCLPFMSQNSVKTSKRVRLFVYERTVLIPFMGKGRSLKEERVMMFAFTFTSNRYINF